MTWLAWSPPGLAKHKRCVLAVLTSNQVLSLWSSKSDMTIPESWERVCVVNHAVNAALRHEGFRERFKSVRNLRLRRIRSAAWAPLLGLARANQRDERVANDELRSDAREAAANGVNGVYSFQDNPVMTSSGDDKLSMPTHIQLLAVANDCGGMYVLKVSSPFQHTSNAWEVTVVEMCSLPTQDDMIENIPQGIPIDDLISHEMVGHQDTEQQTNSRASNARPSLLAAAFAKKNFIEDITWSPWRRDLAGTCEKNILTVRRNGVLSQSNLHAMFGKGIIQCHFSDLMTRKRDLVEAAQRFALWLHEVYLLSSWRARLIIAGLQWSCFSGVRRH